jgi:hypothetical protein
VSLTDVYSQRALAGEAGQEGALLGYMVSVQTFIINPFLMTLGLWNRRKSLFVIGMAGQLYFYAAAAMKTMLLSPLLVILLAFLLKREDRKMGPYIAWGAVVLFLVPFIGPLWSSDAFSLLFGGIVYMRTFAMPGLLLGFYVDFFSHNPLTLFSHVKGISLLVHYPYDLPVPLLIGMNYFNNPKVDANANLWADGFASAGFWGIILISVLTAFVFWLLDSASKGLDRRFATVALCFYAINLTNMSLFSTLLGGGMGLVIVFLYLLPRSVLQEAPDRQRKRAAAGAAHGAIPVLE